MPWKSARNGGRRNKSVQVKTARGRRLSSTRWLDRQLNDPYVAEAQRVGYRSRAAFKLIEIDDRLRLLKPGQIVVDLGAAPGGWTQVALERVKADRSRGRVVALDRREIDPIAGVEVLTADFQAPEGFSALMAAIGGAPVDVVLSDLSPSTTGHKGTDQLRIVALVEDAVRYAEAVLAQGGTLVVKVFQSGADTDVLRRVRSRFDKVRHIKPPASRSDSAETYLVAQGYKGRGTKVP